MLSSDKSETYIPKWRFISQNISVLFVCVLFLQFANGYVSLHPISLVEYVTVFLGEYLMLT